MRATTSARECTLPPASRGLRLVTRVTPRRGSICLTTSCLAAPGTPTGSTGSIRSKRDATNRSIASVRWDHTPGVREAPGVAFSSPIVQPPAEQLLQSCDLIYVDSFQQPQHDRRWFNTPLDDSSPKGWTDMPRLGKAGRFFNVEKAVHAFQRFNVMTLQIIRPKYKYLLPRKVAE